MCCSLKINLYDVYGAQMNKGYNWHANRGICALYGKRRDVKKKMEEVTEIF